MDFSGWRSEFLTGFEQQTATTPSSFVGCQNFQSVVLSSLNCETREQLWTGIPVYLFLFDFLLTNNTAARHKGNKFVLVVRIYAALIIPLSSSQPKARYRLSTAGDKRIEQFKMDPVTGHLSQLIHWSCWIVISFSNTGLDNNYQCRSCQGSFKVIHV